MVTKARKELLSQVNRIVVKVGTAVLADADGQLSESRIRAVTAGLSKLVHAGKRVVLVTSGAIGAGLGEMGIEERPEAMPKLQALAAVGQSQLMKRYDRHLRRNGLHAGQILVTRRTFEDRTAYLNVKHTVAALESYGAIAIINENDSVSTDEIRLGENDILSALVANLLGAQLLLILTCVDGLLDTDGRLVSVVDDVDKVKRLVSPSKSRLGSGGMRTKLEAARIVTRTGEAAVIANGRGRDVIWRVACGQPVGTLFLPVGRRMKGWKRWMRFSGRSRGSIVADDGARRAVLERGKSLLASGVTEVRGDFRKGDLITLVDTNGRELARGVANFSTDSLLKIRGLRSDEVKKLLGQDADGVVIHRDNLVLLD